MTYRHEPTLAEVKAEALRLLPMLREMLPFQERVGQIKIVRRMPEEKIAEYELFEDADGGDYVDITISTEFLKRNGNWKIAVLTRLGHEFYHVRTLQAEANARDGSSGEECIFDKNISDFWEASAEAVESVLHYMATHYQL